jgi:AcrR family transcriptional regulator
MDRREEIYQAALDLFTERGYDNTPLSLIAKKLGLSKGGLFHYFENKEHLLYLLHEYALNRDMIPMIREAESIKDPEERIRFFLDRYTRLLSIEPYAKVLIHEVGRLAPRHKKAITGVWRRTFELIRNALEEMHSSGRAKDVDMTFAAFALIGMCSWIFYWFDYSRRDSAPKLSETFSEIFFKGIGVR